MVTWNSREPPLNRHSCFFPFPCASFFSFVVPFVSFPPSFLPPILSHVACSAASCDCYSFPPTSLSSPAVSPAFFPLLSFPHYPVSLRPRASSSCPFAFPSSFQSSVVLFSTSWCLSFHEVVCLPSLRVLSASSALGSCFSPSSSPVLPAAVRLSDSLVLFCRSSTTLRVF